jgi:hypothetical protein
MKAARKFFLGKRGASGFAQPAPVSGYRRGRFLPG